MSKSRVILVLSLAMMVCGALYASADTLTAAATTSASNTAATYWSVTNNYGTSSSASGDFSNVTPFSLSLSYVLPSDATVTSATLSFGAIGTETAAYNFITNSYSMGMGYWQYCGVFCGSYFVYYSSTPGAMSTSGFQTGYLTQINGLQVSPSTTGTFDLLALGIPLNGSLGLAGTTNQYQTGAITSGGYNDTTYFTSISSGTTDIDALLIINYSQPAQDPPAVPEPATVALLASGLIALSTSLRRQRKM